MGGGYGWGGCVDGILALGAVELVEGYRTGRFTPVDAVEAALRRADDVQRKLNAFVRIDTEGALAEARASAARWYRGEPAGLLDGVPVTVKDTFLQRGTPSLRGSRTVDPVGRHWTEDAPAVARLREQHAVFLGRTTTPEFGWKAVTDSPLTGITRNPYGPDRTSGGSSGGSAVAVATGAGALSIGTDGGGSVRVPAAFCGVLGLKPTYGLVPVYPASVYGSLAHVGPLARDAADAALMMDVLARPDARDPWQAGPPGTGFRAGLDGGVRGLRIAFSPSLGGQVAVRPQVAAVVRRAVERLAGLGAYVEETDPDLTDPVDAFHTLWAGGIARSTRGLGPAQLALLDPGLREMRAAGTGLSGLDVLAAEAVRGELGRRMSLFHQRYDVLLTPTLPLTAFPAGTEVPPGSGARRWTSWTPFTYPFNMTTQPAASVPVGLDGEGLPVGLQIVAARFADRTVLRTAHALYTAGIAGVPAPDLQGPPTDGDRSAG
ncbi:amidase [Streptomyces uncialis]|uniref:Amidase n=1 Tax=Streptomyces uncialis TaxID=1048205 RepID=A0A1Q4V012_9ACTN|nr:amidase [Streptomyces uncialis]